MASKMNRRQISTTKTWVLNDGPMEVMLALRDKKHLTMIAATKHPDTSKKPYVRSVIFLNPSQTEQFFHKLGEHLGYDMPKLSKAVFKKATGTGSFVHIVAVYRTMKQKGRRPLAKLALFGTFGADEDELPGAGGRITTHLTIPKATKIFKGLARELGWELYEKEVWADAA